MKKRGFPLPDGFLVTNQMRVWALSKGLTDPEIVDQTEQFLDRNRATGDVYVDWAAAWRYWMRMYVTRYRKAPGYPGQGGSPMSSKKLN